MSTLSDCDCNAKGSILLQCGFDGNCTCQPAYAGIKCDKCAEGSHRDSAGECTSKLYVILLRWITNVFKIVLACPEGWSPLPSTKGDKCYRISSSNLNYTEAIAQCESLSSKLAEPVDLIESKAIFEATKKATWIGVNDLQEENE